MPQTGILLWDNGELRLKSVGSESIFVTHQLDIFWLKEVASKNISDISVTLIISQLEISWLKSYALLNIANI